MTATNGQDAVDLALKEEFDLILMDLSMPRMDGFKASELIREKRSEPIIIALSASSPSDDLI